MDTHHPNARPMGFISACALGIGTMIGAGIFSLSGEIAGFAGPAAVISYAAGGAAAGILALGFGRLAAESPISGGPYVYIRNALGSTAGFVAGWQLWLGMVLSASFYALGFARYLRYLWPFVPELLAAPLCVALVVAINVWGPGAAAALQNLSVAFLFIVLGGLVVLGLPRADVAFWQPAVPYGWSPVLDAIPLAFTSYLGFEMIAQAAGVIRDPERIVPAAMLTSVLIVTVLYGGVVVVAMGIIHHVDLAKSGAPLAEVARRLVGRPGGALVAAGGLVATLSSANGVIIAAGELALTMAQEGLLPAIFVGRSAGGAGSSRSAHARGIALRTGAVGVVLAGVGTLVGQITWLARGVGALHLLPFALIPLALLRRRSRREQLLGAVGIATMGFLLRHLGRQELGVAILLSLPGLMWFTVRRAGPGR